MSSQDQHKFQSETLSQKTVRRREAGEMSQRLGTLITLTEVELNSQQPSIMGSNALHWQVEEHADRKPIHIHTHTHYLLKKKSLFKKKKEKQGLEISLNG